MKDVRITTVVHSDETASMFDVVERMQESCKGINFFALFIFVSASGLVAQEAPYTPRIQPPLSVCAADGCFILGSLVIPARFEHLLQFVRTFYPGRSFQQMKLRVAGEFLVVGPE